MFMLKPVYLPHGTESAFRVGAVRNEQPQCELGSLASAHKQEPEQSCVPECQISFGTPPLQTGMRKGWKTNHCTERMTGFSMFS